MDKRDYEVFDILIKSNHLTITQIAEQMKLSNKTVSKSLDRIEEFLKGSELSLSRKPKIGVAIIGDKTKSSRFLTHEMEQTVPNTKEERIQYLCFTILNNQGYFTLAQLSDSLFVSKTTLEKDMSQVYEIFDYFHVAIEKIPGKGSFLNIMEYERRKLALDLIHYFWGQNWQVINQDGQFLHLIEGIPKFAQIFINLDYLKQINMILQQFISQNGIKMSDLNYQSLILHLLIAIERIKDNQLIGEQSAEDRQRASGIESLITELEKAFDIQIPEIEIGYIQVYFDQMNPLATNEAVIEETTIGKMILKYTLLDEQTAVNALARHIKLALERIINELPVNNPYTKDIKKNFPLSFDEALTLKSKLEEQYQVFIPEDEVAYMAVHLQAYREQLQTEDTKIDVLLVCSSGKGTSQLLAARIKRTFPEIMINRILSVQELDQTIISEDLVLSTVNISLPDEKLLIVSPILSQVDRQQIQYYLEHDQKKKSRNFEFSRLIKKELIFLDKSFHTIDETLSFLGEQLIEKGYGKSGIIESAKEREQFSYTSFEKFATPHANPQYVKKSAIIFLRLTNEIPWGDTRVRFIFFLCVKDEGPQQLEKIFDSLLTIIDENEKGYLVKGDAQQILDYLKEGL
ncbi:MAG: BglG family transcription antiterminator [Enterococcus sp.]